MTTQPIRTLAATPNAWGVWHPEHPLQVPWRTYLDQVAEVGYTATELGPLGYLPVRPEALSAELASRSLTLTGGYFAGPLHDPEAVLALQETAASVGDLVDPLGARYLVIFPDSYRVGSFMATGSELRWPRELDRAGWADLISTCHYLAEFVFERYGGRMQVVFHVHADTYVETAAQMDTLLERTEPALISACLDTAHYAYRDGDPVAFLRRWHHRTPYLHLKDLDPVIATKVRTEDWPLLTAVQSGIFPTAGEGVVDLVAIADVLRELDHRGDAAVEHDRFPVDGRLPRRDQRITLERLRSAGLTPSPA